MHNIEYFDYPVKGSNKKTIQSDLNEYVSRQTYQEGGHGIEPIRWIDDDVCADYNAAQARIEHLDNHNYDQLAVKYHESAESPKTKAFETLVARRDEINKKLLEVENTSHHKGTKSKFVSCKKCGSKISTEYLDSNYCPVCRADLRPKTLLNSIDKMRERINELNKKIREATIKANKKSPLYWLVKIEYHT